MNEKTGDMAGGRGTQMQEGQGGQGGSVLSITPPHSLPCLGVRRKDKNLSLLTSTPKLCLPQPGVCAFKAS